MASPTVSKKKLTIGDLPVEAQRRIQSYILADDFGRDQPWYAAEDRAHDYSSGEDEEHLELRRKLEEAGEEQSEEKEDKEEIEGGEPGAVSKKELRNAKIKKIRVALEKQEEGQYQQFLKEFKGMGINDLLGKKDSGETCLTMTLKKKDWKLAKALIEAGANPDVPNEADEFPLALTNNIVIADMLVKAGANLKIRDKEGRSLLYKVLGNSDLRSEGGRIAFFEEGNEKRDDPKYLQEFFMRSGMAALGVISLEIFNKELMKGQKRLIKEYGSAPDKYQGDYKVRNSDTWRKMLMLAPAAEAELERRKLDIAMAALAESFQLTGKLERKDREEARAATLPGFERKKSADKSAPADAAKKHQPESPRGNKKGFV